MHSRVPLFLEASSRDCEVRRGWDVPSNARWTFSCLWWLLCFQVGLYLGGSSASAATSAATKCADLLRSRKDPCLQGTVLPFEYEVRHSMGGCNHVLCWDALVHPCSCFLRLNQFTSTTSPPPCVSKRVFLSERG